MTSKFSIDNKELLQRISSGEAVVGIDFGNLIVRELAAFRLAAMDSEPVAGEARFKEERPRWTPCTAEHVSMVLANPEDWPNYEVRYLYTAPQPAPVVDSDDNFYSCFGREWAENYQHNQYTTAAKQMLGVMAESAWKAGRRAAMLQASPVCTCPSGDGSLRWPCLVHPGNSPIIGIDLASGQDRTVEVRYVAPPGYVMVPKEPTQAMCAAFNDSDYGRKSLHERYVAMLAAAPQEFNHD